MARTRRNRPQSRQSVKVWLISHTPTGGRALSRPETPQTLPSPRRQATLGAVAHTDRFRAAAGPLEMRCSGRASRSSGAADPQHALEVPVQRRQVGPFSARCHHLVRSDQNPAGSAHVVAVAHLMLRIDLRIDMDDLEPIARSFADAMCRDRAVRVFEQQGYDAARRDAATRESAGPCRDRPASRRAPARRPRCVWRGAEVRPMLPVGRCDRRPPSPTAPPAVSSAPREYCRES
jgi:hypothetical protein